MGLRDESEPEPKRECPECKSPNCPENTACTHCGHRLAGKPTTPEPDHRTTRPASIDSDFNPYAAPESLKADGPVFRIHSLLLVIALIAVCMGVIREAPGLGVPLAVVSFIALARTMIISGSRGGGKEPLSVAGKLALFFATVGMAVVILTCIAIALFATCLAIFAASGISGGPTAFLLFAVPLILLLLGFLLWSTSRIVRWLGRIPSIRSDEPDEAQRGPQP